MNKIRVLLADDHTLVRQGIAGLLSAQPDIEVVGEAANGAEAVEKTCQLCPDVVLLDIAMPELNGLEATRRLKEALPQVRILILTIHDREDYLFIAIKSGAAGYVLKGADVSELISAVHSVHRGEVFLYPSLTKKLVSDYLRRVETGEAEESYRGLTAREREILRLIAEGLTNPQISRQLHLSTHTVQSHRENIMKKLNLRSKAELIKYAIRHGLIEA